MDGTQTKDAEIPFISGSKTIFTSGNLGGSHIIALSDKFQHWDWGKQQDETRSILLSGQLVGLYRIADEEQFQNK